MAISHTPLTILAMIGITKNVSFSAGLMQGKSIHLLVRNNSEPLPVADFPQAAQSL